MYCARAWRASTFRKPEVLRQALEEEGRAGWTLVEKFDDARLRFKRPASTKQNDSNLTIDPYRSVYGWETADWRSRRRSR